MVHHTYVNITGHDADIELGVLGRLTPHQKRFRFHRWQQFYLWPLYGVNIIKWHLYDDFRDVILGRIGPQRMPRPKRWELVSFIGAKLLFLAMAFALPMLVHRVWVVLAFYCVAVTVAGVVVSVVFQLAHCVEEAEFPMPREIPVAWRTPGPYIRLKQPWILRAAAGWKVGCLAGLNFQIEHHLFPRVCHVNYPDISKLVETNLSGVWREIS